jgi:chromate reductase
MPGWHLISVSEGKRRSIAFPVRAMDGPTFLSTSPRRNGAKMTPIRHIAVIVGSLRKDSLNRKMALAASSLAPASLHLEIVEIGALPHYNADLEEGTTPPAEWLAFREQIRSAQGVLFVTPEFNRSVPGALKNAIDVGSRPYGQSAWAGKPCGVISVTPGALGAFGANHHLRQSFVFLDMPAMQQPEAYIGNAANLFDDKGVLTNAGTRDFLAKYMQALAEWVERHV